MPEEPAKQELETFVCVAEPHITTVQVAKCPADSTLKNVKTIPRKLRIQVLDCRSGQPVPNATLLDFSFDGDPAWDLEANYLIPVKTAGASAGQPLNPTGFTVSNRRSLQRLLNALGFHCGPESAAFGERGWAALKAYQYHWYLTQAVDPGKQTFERKVTDEWQRRIIEEYNQHFTRTVQFHLTLLGFPCLEDDGEWRAASQKAFEDWQRVELGSKKPYSTFNAKQDMPQRRALAARIQGQKKPFLSDENGIIHIPVAAERVRKGFSLKLAFRDFAIRPESGMVERDLPVTAATRFSIEWAPDAAGQDTEGTGSGKWGWRLRPPGNREPDATTLPEFAAFLEISLPACADLDWKRLHEEKKIFSKFYQGHGGDTPEFVVWALVWSQPVWDGVVDPTRPDVVNNVVYVQNDIDRDRNMHLVTLYSDGAGSDPYGGKGYGMLEKVAAPRWRGDDGHAGHDLYARIGDPVFAVHGGNAKRVVNNAVQGNAVHLKWVAPPGVHSSIECLHLSAFVAEKLKYVRAGALIGKAGRTGNLGQTTRWPTHCHVNVGASGYNSRLRDAADDANKICIPSNETALMLPCACQITKSDEDPSGCDFTTTKFVNSCWAVAELKCPNMNGAGKEDRRAQAQLRYLFEQNGSPYLDPGPLDGSLGAVPVKPKDRVGRARLAIRAFRVENGMPAGYELDGAARAALDSMAPVTTTGGG